MTGIFELADKIVTLLIEEEATYLDAHHALKCVREHLKYRETMEQIETQAPPAERLEAS